uniref:52 kDa repressor of the inhibitor of the protein kinase-like n=1 Tax=Styela clava TaxID=7725 RepID=UPI0019396C58|nr:52 kDa repressor of the inhibitor of the protein kinase-like [Styela clava]
MSERLAKQAKLTSYFIQQNPSVQKKPGTSSTSATSEIHPDLTHPDFVISSEWDIGAYDSKGKLSDQQKYNFLTNTWKPKSLYKFPRVERKVKGKVRYVSFQRKWLDEIINGWHIAHRKMVDSANHAGYLPRKDSACHKEVSPARTHESRKFHTNTKIIAWKCCGANVTESSDENRKGMLSLINIVKLCGGQMLSFRGHRDFGKIDQPEDFETNENKGNFRALVRFRIQSGDEVLRRFILSSGINAQYTSWSTQNEIVQLCGGFVRKALVQRISESGYFSVLADETSDVSNCEQFSICVRWFHYI